MSLSECLTEDDMEISLTNVSKMSKRCQSLELYESQEISYLKFISTLPRLCSPTICGTVNYKTPKKWSSMSSLEYKPFEWSIEQKAHLDPCDFSNAEDVDLFKQIDEQIVSKQLDEENDRFFAQKQIIPSPKTPEKKNFIRISDLQMSGKSTTFWSPIHSNNKTPDYRSNNGNNSSIDCHKTPLNCSKLRQKKKLFLDDHYLMDSIANRSPKDSAFETIDETIDSQSFSQSVIMSPIYCPDWRNTSLLKRITHLSPIQSRIENYVEMDFPLDQNSLKEESITTKTDTYSQQTYDMLSIESQNEDQNMSISRPSSDSVEAEVNVLPEYNRQNRFQTYLTKTSTPSHL